MAYFIKQTDEKFPIAADFSDVLATGETIVAETSEVIAYDSGDNDVSSTILVEDSKSVLESLLLAKVRAGVDGKKYKVTFKAMTSNNNIYELDIFMIIKNE